MVQVKRERERSSTWEGRVEEEYLGGLYLWEANMKNQWRHNELHLECCQTLAQGWLACWPHCEAKAVYITCQYGFGKSPLRIQAASFREFYLCGCSGCREPLSITVCLFPSVLRNSFINLPPHIPCRQPIYLPSLQRPYTQHASQSHLQFSSCSL